MKAPHLKVVEPPSSSSQPEDVSFEQWLRGFGNKFKASGILVILSPIAPLIYSKLSNLDQKWILPVACSIQFVVIFGLIVWFAVIRVRNFSRADESSDEAKAREEQVRIECEYTDPKEWADAKKDAETALKHYYNYWVALLVSWFLLYALLAFLYLSDMAGHKYLVHALKISVNFVNNCASLAFLFCYFTLNQPEALSNQGRQNGKEKHWGLWIAILIMLAVLEAVCVALALKNILPNEIKAEDVSVIFGYVGGAGAAAAMGLYISRLGSRFLACPFWVIDLLYIYMAIQPMFAKFMAQNMWAAIILTNAALLLKGLLCLYMVFLFEQGRLLFYFVRVKRLGEMVSSQMRNFSLILEK